MTKYELDNGKKKGNIKGKIKFLPLYFHKCSKGQEIKCGKKIFFSEKIKFLFGLIFKKVGDKKKKI